MAQLCDGCGSAVGAGDAFCGQCGAPVAQPLSTTASEPPVRPDQAATIVTGKHAAGPDPAGPVSAGPVPAVTPPDGLPVPGGAGSWPRAEDEPAPPGRPVWPTAPSTGQAAPPPYQAERDYGAPQAGQGADWAGNSSGVPIGTGPERARARPAPDGASPAEAAAPSTAALVAHAENLRYENAGMAYVTMGGRAIFDPLYNKRFQIQLLRQVAVFVGLYALAQVAMSVFFLVLGIAGLGVTRTFSAWVIFDTLLSLVLWVLFWLIPVPALLTQWSLLVQHRAGAAGTAFAYIDAAFRRHETPLDLLQTRSLSPPGEGSRDYLELRQGRFAGYISCFPHGNDLYVGWTYWLRLSPLRWFLMIIGRKIQEYTGRGSDLYQTLRFESARATVAAMHDAVVEGIDSATAELDPQAPRLITQQASAFGFTID